MPLQWKPHKAKPNLGDAVTVAPRLWGLLTIGFAPGCS